jgi:sulfur-carrier protein adenylyltransferase/sulfurtransferase
MKRRPAELSAAERARYARHLVIPEIGEAGQRRLKASRVLVVGLGGLGSPVSLYLAAAGVGTLGIIDADVVDVSNLQRQVLYTEKDEGQPKAEAARGRLASLNSLIRIEAYNERFAGRDARRVAADYDLIVDGTDNLESRYVMSDVALELGVPYVYGAVYQLEGQAALLCVPGAPCYRCLFPAPPPAASQRPASETGILGVVPGVIGLVQATEAVRWLTGYAEPGPSRLLLYDARRIEFTSIPIEPDALCSACGGSRVKTKPTSA